MTYLIILTSAALYYLGSRALITSFLWTRYPSWLVGFMDCSACTGFWYGLVLAAVLGFLVGTRATYMSLPLEHAWAWPLVGLASIVTTPITAGVMQWGLDTLGHVAPSDDSNEKPFTTRLE